MKLIYFLFSSILILFPQIKSTAQSFNIEWQGCYGGSDTEYSRDIISVNDGYLVLGYTESDDGDISFNHGSSDVWIFKISNTGELLWEKTYGGSNGDGGRKLIPDGQGNIYIVGGSDSNDGDISNDPYPDSWDFWIIKIDSIGNIIWEKVLGGSQDETLWTATKTLDGGVIACGWTASDDGDISTYYGLYDGWLVKINSEGEKEWDFTIGTNGQDVAQAVIQTSDGGYLVGCSSMIWDTGNITCVPHSEYAEAVLVKLDSNLNIEWNHCYGGSDIDGATALVEVNDGYIFGGYTHSDDGDVSGWHGESDLWVVKIDYNSNIIWQRCLGGSRSEGFIQLFVANDETIIITGNTQSTDGDVTGNHTISEYEHDIWLVKLDGEGELISEHCFGGEWDEQINFGFLQKSTGDYIFAGQTDYGPSYDVECNTFFDPDFWVFEVKDTLVGMQQNTAIENELKVYPIPAKDYVVFEASSPLIPPQGIKSGTNGATVTIVDIFGREVVRLPVKQDKTYSPSASLWRTRWDCRNAKNGIYFYKIDTKEALYTGKIIVQK